jgi:hypothetical protein
VIFFIGLFALWQMGSFVHFTTVRHSIGPNGKVYDTESRNKNSDQKHNNSHSKQRDCNFLANFIFSDSIINANTKIELNNFDAVNKNLIFFKTLILCKSDVYFLSPSNSPPYLSLL